MLAVDAVIGACKNVVLDLIIPDDSGTPFQRSSVNCSYNLVTPARGTADKSLGRFRKVMVMRSQKRRGTRMMPTRVPLKLPRRVRGMAVDSMRKVE